MGASLDRGLAARGTVIAPSFGRLSLHEDDRQGVEPGGSRVPGSAGVAGEDARVAAGEA